MFHSGEGSSRVSRMKIPRRIFLRALPPRPVAAAAAIAAAIEASESFFGNPIGSTKGEEKKRRESKWAYTSRRRGSNTARTQKGFERSIGLQEKRALGRATPSSPLGNVRVKRYLLRLLNAGPNSGADAVYIPIAHYCYGHIDSAES